MRNHELLRDSLEGARDALNDCVETAKLERCDGVLKQLYKALSGVNGALADLTSVEHKKG